MTIALIRSLIRPWFIILIKILYSSINSSSSFNSSNFNSSSNRFRTKLLCIRLIIAIVIMKAIIAILGLFKFGNRR